MPKIKTNRAAAKRLRVTASGKLKRKKANLNHILTKKKPKRKARLGKKSYIDDSNLRNMRRLLGLQ